MEFVLLVDPDLVSSADDDPPFDAVIGMWPLLSDGTTGKFQSNPDYVPRFEESPADPLDALLRLSVEGAARVSQLQDVLRDCTFELAMNGDGRPLIDRDPSGEVPVLLVATSAVHRARVPAPDWRLIDLDALLPLAEGRDVLFNAGGPAPVRLSADFLSETAAL